MAIYRTMQGREFNMDEFRQKNEQTVAVSNYGVINARGDMLGKDGEVIKKREELVHEWYKNNQAPVINEPTVRKERMVDEDVKFTDVRSAAIDVLDAHKSKAKSKTDTIESKAEDK